ncbi:hypothetical protein EI42_06343 [Thermosporothrix hazakensis]|jgi:hypothetical protein|uniref:Uncharacterized protein n=1 Tax=Thermosporothrix hazakensis TaxID=644383 RepID=A0A326U3L6_THEHA|nr:hypothetical protein [Thermosporothrix hazakensis]PZW18117.1 hypothetical protein EI42_06343 [Thermosporothrix hazakensis]GCE50620.1 hypothetical protein KTH_54890 [Thermosporothrix hazakensis]
MSKKFCYTVNAGYQTLYSGSDPQEARRVFLEAAKVPAYFACSIQLLKGDQLLGEFLERIGHRQQDKERLQSIEKEREK